MHRPRRRSTPDGGPGGEIRDLPGGIAGSVDAFGDDQTAQRAFDHIFGKPPVGQKTDSRCREFQFRIGRKRPSGSFWKPAISAETWNSAISTETSTRVERFVRSSAEYRPNSRDYGMLRLDIQLVLHLRQPFRGDIRDDALLLFGPVGRAEAVWP